MADNPGREALRPPRAASQPPATSAVNFTLPEVAEGRSWLGLIDTNQPFEPMAEFKFGHSFAATGRSLLVLALVNESTATGRLRQGLGALLDVADMPLPN